MFKPAIIKTPLIYLIFMASGASALVYQVIWSRWLGLMFGNTTTSIAIVLGVFMTGLALGSWTAGLLLPRIRKPMRGYAYMEFGIGIFALCFPLLAKEADLLFTAVISAETSRTVSILARGGFAFILLLVPTTCMGATLPLLTDYFRRHPQHAKEWKVGLLYAANSLGAALGVIAASFFLIELIGVFATTLAAASLNLLIGAIAFKFAASPGVLPDDAPVSTVGRTLAPVARIAIAILTASGALAMASEVLWTRTLETLVGNSTYAFAMILLLYLAGIAAGSWLMALLVNRLKQTLLWLIALQGGMAVWTFVAIYLFQWVAGHLSQHSGELVSIYLMIWNNLKVMIILLPLALLSGACFPLATRIIDPSSEEAQGGLIARAYTWNTVGAVLGSLLAGFVIAPALDYFDSLYLLMFLYGTTATVATLLSLPSEWPRRINRAAILGVGVFSLVLTGTAAAIVMGGGGYATPENMESSHLVVSHKPGLQGITTVLKRRDESLADILLVNGMGMTVKITDTKMMAHLPMIIHPDPQDTLVICFGMGTTYRSAISYGGNVTVVELVEEVVEAFDYFYEDAARVRSYARGRMVVDDGRDFLKLTRQKFDVITLDPPPPIDGAGVNNLYSKEFIELAKSRLKKGGIMAHWMPYPNTMSGVDDEEIFNMLVQTFMEVFPYVGMKRGYHGVGLHLLGFMEPPDLSLALVKQRLAQEAIAGDLREWDFVPLTYFEGINFFQSTLGQYPLVTDDRPRLEFYLLRTLRKGGKKMYAYNYWCWL